MAIFFFSNTEECTTAAITSSDPNTKLLVLLVPSFGTDFRSDIPPNVTEKWFALILKVAL